MSNNYLPVLPLEVIRRALILQADFPIGFSAPPLKSIFMHRAGRIVPWDHERALGVKFSYQGRLGLALGAMLHWGGGGHCLFEGRYPKQNYRPPVLPYHSPLLPPLPAYSPLLLSYQRIGYCYYSCPQWTSISIFLISLLL